MHDLLIGICFCAELATYLRAMKICVKGKSHIVRINGWVDGKVGWFVVGDQVIPFQAC